LQNSWQRHGRGLIVVDALYSTNGSVAPLVGTGGDCGAQRLHAAGRRVAFAGHARAAGAGLVAALGLSERVHFRTASLAKAFAGRAG
jgi:CAI-1 autoinducer synthase